MRLLIFFCVFCLSFFVTKAQSLTHEQYKEDFEQFWKEVNDHFAYFHIQQTRWDQVKEGHQQQLDTVQTRKQFVTLLESMIHELYNGHVSLNTNTSASPRLIPSGADFWIEKKGNDFIIEGVYEGGKAEKAGLRVGMHVIAYNGIPVEEAAQAFLPRSVEKPDTEVWRYAANVLLAGKRNETRKITIQTSDGQQDFFPDEYTADAKDGKLSSRILEPSLGVIRLHNSLGDKETIAAFDQVLDDLMAKGVDKLILDLRDVPSGGTNTVAKGIMGRFISEELPYQRYRFTDDERDTDVPALWMEYVMPRGNTFTGKVALLCNQWTGSIGEAMVIGFDGMARATIFGTRMAGLLGAIDDYKLKHSKIGFQIPITRLYHIDGTAREDFRPAYILKDNEACFEAARTWLLQQK